MTLQEIKEQYAAERGYSSWFDYDQYMRSGFKLAYLDEVSVLYAKECCKASLKKAADRKIKTHGVDKSLEIYNAGAITNPENIILCQA